MTETTLIIGDAHVEAGENLKRFINLGHYIVDTQPDNIVIIGDFVSLDSLSAWDLNKRSRMEGRRFNEELKFGCLALQCIMNPMIDFRVKQQNQKKKMYFPNMYVLEGNHEDRWNRYLETKPELIDTVDIYKSMWFHKYGWKVIPYKEYLYIRGVGFTHVPMGGDNNPIRGASYMQNACRDHDESVVFGHTHRLAIATNARHGQDANQVISVNVGCFFDGVPNYAKGSKSSHDWWRGLVMLHHYKDGKFDVSTYSLDRLYEEYDTKISED